MNTEKFNKMYQEEQQYILASKQVLIQEMFPNLPLSEELEITLARNLSEEAYNDLLEKNDLYYDETIALDEYSSEDIAEYVNIKKVIDACVI